MYVKLKCASEDNINQKKKSELRWRKQLFFCSMVRKGEEEKSGKFHILKDWKSKTLRKNRKVAVGVHLKTPNHTAWVTKYTNTER